MAIAPQTVEQAHELIARQSQASLKSFLGHVRINSRPKPLPWKQCIEPWQKTIVNPIIPAIEHIAGVREDYSGPRNFMFVMPRGHDKTGLIARLSNWVTAFSRQPIRGVVGAGKREQAGYVLDAMDAELQLNPWLKKRLEIQRHVAIGTNGSQLEVLSSDGGLSYGETPDLTICDEFTWWKGQAGHDFYDALFTARHKRPTGIFIIITNAGMRGSWQHKIYLHALKHPENWHVYSVPECQHLAGWMSAKQIAEDRATVSPGTAKRVYDNKWVDVTETPLLPFELLEPCFDKTCLWPIDNETKYRSVPKGEHPELYLGVDVGRTKHRSVIWTFERVGDVLWTREVFVMHNEKFSAQKHEIRKRMSKFVVKAHIDKGGIGMDMAEELTTEFREKFEGVQLSTGKQGQLALSLQTAFKEHKVRIPDDKTEPDITTDFQMIDEVDTANGSPALKTNEGETGHGDRFWAAALALYGVPVEVARKRVSRQHIQVLR